MLFTEEEMEQVELVINFMETKVNGYRTAIANGNFPLDLQSNPQMYDDFVEALAQFSGSSIKIKENRLSDLSEEQWKLINLLGIVISGECQTLGGPFKAIGESIAYTFVEIITPKWSGREAI